MSDIFKTLAPLFHNHWQEKYKKRFPTHASKILLFDAFLVVVLATVGISALFATFILPAFILEPALITLSTQLPTSVESGVVFPVSVTYENTTDQPLECAEVIVQFSTAFFVDQNVTSLPVSGCATRPLQNQKNAAVLIGTIAPHTKSTVTFRGAVYGPKNAQISAVSKLQYWELAHTTPTVTYNRNTFAVSASPLDLRLIFSKEIPAGEPGTVTIIAKNTSALPIQKVVLTLAPPSAFTAAAGPQTWQIGTLATGQSRSVVSAGVLTLGTVGQFSARATMQKNTVTVLVADAEENATPSIAGLILTPTINPPTGFLIPGNTYTIRVQYQNTGTQVIKNARVTVDGIATQLSIPQNIAPGANGNVSTQMVMAQTTSATQFRVQARGQYTQGTSTNSIRVVSPEILLPITARMTLVGATVFTSPDGDQFGAGPLPPKVGVMTSYQIILTANNDTGATNNVDVTAELAPNVTWLGQSSVTAGEAIDYLPLSGTIRWRVGALQKNAVATLLMGITPQKNDIGTAPPILKNIKITGIDTATGARLTFMTRDISTVLANSSPLDSKNLVVK